MGVSLNGSTMSEIERAIEYIDGALFYAKIGSPKDTDELMNVKKLLTAELEREKNEPLTEEELPSIVGKPYYHVSLDGNGSEWKIMLNADAARFPKQYRYGDRWIAYRYEPKGEPNV